MCARSRHQRAPDSALSRRTQQSHEHHFGVQLLQQHTRHARPLRAISAVLGRRTQTPRRRSSGGSCALTTAATANSHQNGSACPLDGAKRPKSLLPAPCRKLMPRMRPNPSASAPHCASRERARAKFSPMDLLELLPSTWQPLLGVEGESALAQVGKFLDAEEQAERSFQPQAERLFRALTLTPPLAVRCVLTGQDPYPTPNVPTGLSFDVGPTAPLSGSLRNIFREFVEDTLLPRPSSGDLTPWTEHCLLLNAALSCQPGVAGSHDKCGWHGVTQALLTGLTAINPDIVFLCWGARALSMVQKLPPVGRVIASAHPSPLSAHRGFFGSRPFTRTNKTLIEFGREPINWQLP